MRIVTPDEVSDDSSSDKIMTRVIVVLRYIIRAAGLCFASMFVIILALQMLMMIYGMLAMFLSIGEDSGLFIYMVWGLLAFFITSLMIYLTILILRKITKKIFKNNNVKEKKV